MLTFSNISKIYPDGTIAVKNFNLEINRGEFVTFIGPSGCGKSTTLRMINRLEDPSSGTINIDGKDYKSYHPVELRRKLGYVIQQVGLIPHLTIAENISFVLKLQGAPKLERQARAKELLELINMDPKLYMNRYPRELSGGQQQRIGVLRALAHNPDTILMDEPFGALDPITREQLQDELKRLQRNFNKTIIFVTHDMDEAIRLADNIVIMKSGEIIQTGNPEEILRSPADDFVANFIGKQRFMRQAADTMVKDLLIKDEHLISIPGIYVRENATIMQAAHMMLSHQLDRIAVVNNERQALGWITRASVVELLDGVEKEVKMIS
jgi:osmoprotectant transport system ATP-binding protein